MKEYVKKLDKKTVIFSVLLFAIFSVLVYLFPYSGDDWAWGSEIGLDRLESRFDNYNGRYVGNLLVLALTRSKLLCILVIAISLVCICIFPRMFSGSKKFFPYVFGTFLFLLLPKEILVQSVVWTSGFSNYLPPIILTMGYFVVVKNVFEDDKPKYSWVSPIMVAVIGFISALFMENVSLYNIVVAALIIVFVLIKFKKVYLTHIAYLAGCIIGAVFMFSNSVYGSIANGTDDYRTTAFGEGMKTTIIEHTDIIFGQFFANNIPVLIILSLLCVAVYLLYAKSAPNQGLKTMGLAFVMINLFCLSVIFAKHSFPEWGLLVAHPATENISILVFALIALAYCVSAFLIVLLCIKEKKTKYKTLLLLISVPVLIAPLVVVNPIGPRCFFPPYFMLIAACVMIGVHIQSEIRISAGFGKCICASLLTVSMSIVIFLMSIYSVVHTYDMKRNEYVKKQIEAGYETVLVCMLPYDSYIWMGQPESYPWDERYKYFYDIDQSISFGFTDYKSFDAWVEAFDEEMKN